MADIPQDLKRCTRKESTKKLIKELKDTHVVDLDELADDEKQLIEYYHSICPRLADHQIIIWSSMEKSIQRGPDWELTVKLID